LLNGHTHFWTKDTIGHLGVGIHICYGDRKWDNHSVFCFLLYYTGAISITFPIIVSFKSFFDIHIFCPF